MATFANDKMIQMKTLDSSTHKDENDNRVKKLNAQQKQNRLFKQQRLDLNNNKNNNANINTNEDSFMIELIDVNIQSKNRSFESINLRIHNGQIFGIIGSKNVGKTILLETIATIRSPNSGEITYYGQPYDNPVRIGFMPQIDGYFPQLSIAENIILYTRLHGLTLDAANLRYERLINLIGLDEAKQPINQLDQTKQSLISLLLASIHSPSVLILDEPDFGSDLIMKELIWKQLKLSCRKEQITIIFSTKYVEDCRYADQAAIINQRHLYTCQLYSIKIVEPIASGSSDDNENNGKYSTININDYGKINEFARYCLSTKLNNGIFLSEASNNKYENLSTQLEPSEPNRYRQVASSQKYRTIFSLLIKLFIFKQIRLSLFQLLLPLLSTIFCLQLLGQNPHELRIAVYNPDSPAIVSKHVLNVLKSNEEIKLIYHENLDDTIQMVRNGLVWAALEFPANYTNSIFNQALQNCDDVTSDDHELESILKASNETFSSSTTTPSTTTADYSDVEYETKINMVTILMYVDNTNLLIAGFVKAKVLQALERAHHDAKENEVETRMTQPLMIVQPNIYGNEDTPMTDFILPGIIMLSMQFSIAILSIHELNFLLKSNVFRQSLSMARISKSLLITFWFFIKLIIIFGQIMMITTLLTFTLDNQRFHPTGLRLFIVLAILQSILFLLIMMLSILCTKTIFSPIIIYWINFLIQTTLSGLLFPLECLPRMFNNFMLYSYPWTSIAESMRSAMSRGWSFDHYIDHQHYANHVWLAINLSSIWIVILIFMLIFSLNNQKFQ